MLRELKTGAPNQFVGTLWAKPNMWTPITWRKTYGFEPDGKGFCARNEDFTPGRFSSPVHNKDDYLTSDCSNPRARRVLEFLVPIVLPDKSARVTVGVASLILNSFEGKRPVDWGLIFYGTVKKMVSVLGGTKPSSLTPFLFHLYKAAEYLDQEEEAYYKATRVAEAYGFKDSEEESNHEDSEESGPEETGPSEPGPPVEVTPESAKTKKK